MRSASAAFTAHLAGNDHSRARMLLIALADGALIGLTNTDHDIAFDLSLHYADVPAGAVTYLADPGLSESNVEMNAGLDAGSFEFRGALGPLFTRPQIIGGRFEEAGAWLFDVNWEALADGPLAFMRGFVSQMRATETEFIGEVQDQRAKLHQNLLRVIQTQCWKDFASPECGATATVVTATVTAVGGPLDLTVSYPGTFADHFFNKGKVSGLTGVNAGVSRKIERWTAAGAVELFHPFAADPDIGDTFLVSDGCSKLRHSTDATVPTCKTHNRVALGFGGYPDGPGSQALNRIAIPGEGNQ